MKKNRFVMALTVVAAGATFAVGAKSSLINFPELGSLINPAQVRVSNVHPAPSESASIHDDFPTSGTFVNTLANPQISQHQDGDTIIVMTASGQLPGTLTVKIQRDESGAITDGEWAFLVSYLKEVHNEDGTHSESLIQRGTVKGTVASGQLTADENGSISSIDSIQLAVNGGTLTFQATVAGHGTGQANSLLDAGNASGGLTLTF